MDAGFALSPIGGLPISLAQAGLVRLFELRNANLNSTADQQFSRVGGFTQYQIAAVVAIARSGNALLAAGGIYSAASKTGVTIVNAAQPWGALSAATKVLTPTLAALTDALTSTPYLSLTTAAGAASVCDVWVFGYTLD